MNKRRRLAVGNVLIHAKSALEDLLEEEEDAMANVPEALTSSERYEAMESAVDFLNDAVDQIEELYDMWMDL